MREQNLNMNLIENIDGFNACTLTTDVDWAPDYAVEDFINIVDNFGFSASIFATHKSAILHGLGGRFEIGLHPDNTRPHPKFGLSRKIIDLLEIYPDSVGVRCHRNFFGQNIAQLAAESGLAYDASVFLWRHLHLAPWRDQYGLIRIAYNWEDGIQADFGLDWDLGQVPFDGPGMKVFNFHPIFIYLNCPDDAYRRSVVGQYKDLTSAPRSEIEPHIYKGYGARNFMIDLLTELSSRGVRCIRLCDVADATRATSIKKGA